MIKRIIDISDRAYIHLKNQHLVIEKQSGIAGQVLLGLMSESVLYKKGHAFFGCATLPYGRFKRCYSNGIKTLPCLLFLTRAPR